MRTAALSLAFLALAAAEPSAPPLQLLGTCVHFAQGKGERSENLDLVRAAGFTLIREDVGWAFTEPKPGQYRFDDRLVAAAAERGLACLYILGEGNPLYDDGAYPLSAAAVEAYARYCEAAVRHFQGKVRHFQVWNEWEGGTGMRRGGKGRPADYLRLLAAAYPRMKAVDPGITVIANSICGGPPVLDELLAGGLLGMCDVVAVNCYAFRQADPSGQRWFQLVEGFQEQCRRRNDGRDFPVMVTEFGWPTNSGPAGSTPDDAGRRGAQAFLLGASVPWLRGLCWYDFQDDGWAAAEREDNFGILRPDLTPKPGYYALADAVGLVGGARFAERLAMPGGEAVVALRFQRPDGGSALALWSAEREAEFRLALVRDPAASGPVQQRLIGRCALARPWTARDWAGNPWKAALDPTTLAVTAGADPLVIEGDLRGLRIAACQRVSFPQDRQAQVPMLRLPVAIACATPVGHAQRNQLTLSDWHSFSGALAGPADLSARCTLAYTAEALVLTVAITDNVHHQDRPVAEAWVCDSIQFGLRDPSVSGDQPFTQFDCAEVEGRPQVLRRFSQAGLPQRVYDPAGPATATVAVAGAVRTWTITIPVAEVPLARWTPGSLFAFTILVNDNDGTGRKGYLRWGDGLGGSKDPTRLNWVVLVP